MTPLSKLPIGSIVSFEMYPATVIGARFDFVQISDHMSADTVRALGVDTIALHQAVRPSLPPDVPNDPRQYRWIKVVLPSGEFRYFGAPWIKESSIVITDARKVQFTCDISNEDEVPMILQALASIGKKAVNVVVLDATGPTPQQ